VLRDILGHSDASMTERYKNTSREERALVQERCS
jgi:integrase